MFGLLEPVVPAVPGVIYLLLTQTRKQGHESFLKSFPKSASFPWEAVKGAWDELTGSGSATQRGSSLPPAPLYPPRHGPFPELLFPMPVPGFSLLTRALRS